MTRAAARTPTAVRRRTEKTIQATILRAATALLLLLLLLPRLPGAQPVNPPLFPTAGNSAANPLHAAPVVGAGDVSPSNPMPTSTPEAATSAFSATGAGVLNLTDAALGAYAMALVSITAAGTGNSVVFEGSNDGIAFSTVTCIRSNGLEITSSISYAGEFYCPTAWRYFQVRLSAYGSGTVAGTVSYKRTPTGSPSAQAVKAAPTGGATAYAVNSTASTNAALVSSGAHNLYAYHLCNSGTVAGFVRLFDSASAPTPASTTPKVGAIMVPAGGCAYGGVADVGLYFNLGLGIAITAGAASNDNTALTANTVVTGYLAYK